MLNCNKCGFDNELGRIFCHQCGAKLDLDQIKPPSRGGKSHYRKRTEFSPRRVIRVVIDLLVIGGLVGIVYLLARVPAVRSMPTGPDIARSASQKRALLETMTARHKAVTVDIGEVELNAYLDQFGFREAEGEGLKVHPINFQVETGDGTLKLIMLGQVKWGNKFSKDLYVSYTGVPTVEDGAFVFKPVAGAIGALPIHPWVLQNTTLMQRYFSQIIGGLTDEKRILDHLTSIQVKDGHILLTYQPPH